MIEVKVYKRDKNGNRGRYLTHHIYPTLSKAEAAITVMKKLSKCRKIIAPIDNEIVISRQSEEEERIERSWVCEYNPKNPKKPLKFTDLYEYTQSFNGEGAIPKPEFSTQLYVWKKEEVVIPKKVCKKEFNTISYPSPIFEIVNLK